MLSLIYGHSSHFILNWDHSIMVELTAAFLERTMRIPLCSFLRNRVLVLLSLFTFLLAFSGVEALGQATIATGAIQGTVTDQSDAVVPGAVVTIRNVGTAQTIV